MARQVKIEILGDARGLRSAFREAERSTTGFGKGIAKAGVFAATGLAGIAAGVGVALTKSIQAAQESNKIGKQTEAVLKSTGGAAKVTAKQVSDLATAISMKTGIDDEAIQSSENMLLTFTNIKNAVGKNNDIFTQATRITQDMAVALGQDGTQSAMQLGKALQDPIRGVTALRRVGVAFTADQQKQIKVLVDSGKTMEAQKLILAELGKEFGGSAAAAATPLDKLKVVVGNLEEAIGNALLPTVNKVANFLAREIPKALETASKWWKDNKDAVGALATVLLGTFIPASGTARDKINGLSTATENLQHKLSTVAIFAASLVKWWIETRIQSTRLMSATYSLIIALGHTANAIGLITGAGRHAGDSLVKFGQDGKRVADRDLGKLEKAAKDTQAAIDRMHGKDIAITGSLKLNFTKSFTQKDWVDVRLAAGRMAGGGMLQGPGTGTSDSIPLWGSKGEFMVNAAATSKWLPVLKFINADRKATGGPIGQIDSESRAVNKVEAWGTGRRMDRGLGALMRKFASGGGNLRAFILSTDALPYIWSGVGPGGYDCSGLTGEVFARMTHRPSYRRYFTTASNFTALGFKPGGGGMYQIGVNRGHGHMVGRYAGLPFEAESTRTGIKVGAAATSVFSMPEVYHLAKGGLIGGLADWLAQQRGIAIGGDPAKLRLERFDRGGYLQPGMSLAYNGTGRPEPVGAVGTTVVNIYPAPGMSERRVGQMVVEALEARDRRARKGGRP